jgi:hypothetical protein
LQLHELSLLVLNALHLRVDDTSIMASTVNVKDLGVTASVSQSGHEHVLEVDGENLGEAFPTSSLECIGGVISSGPSICVGVSTSGEFVKNTLKAIVFGAHKAEMLKSMRRTRVIMNFCG